MACLRRDLIFREHEAAHRHPRLLALVRPGFPYSQPPVPVPPPRQDPHKQQHILQGVLIHLHGQENQLFQRTSTLQRAVRRRWDMLDTLGVNDEGHCPRVCNIFVQAIHIH